MMNISETACLMLVYYTVVYIVPYHAQILPPLGRFAPSHITFGDIEISVISRGARSLNILIMNIS